MTDERKIINPGPASLPPGQCPNGVIIQHYAVPSGLLVNTAYVAMDEDVLTAGMEAAITFAQLAPPGSDVCLVAFDGDTGERMDWGPSLDLLLS